MECPILLWGGERREEKGERREGREKRIDRGRESI
jgi:hypothetical protein